MPSEIYQEKVRYLALGVGLAGATLGLTIGILVNLFLASKPSANLDKVAIGPLEPVPLESNRESEVKRSEKEDAEVA